MTFVYSYILKEKANPLPAFPLYNLAADKKNPEVDMETAWLSSRIRIYSLILSLVLLVLLMPVVGEGCTNEAVPATVAVALNTTMVPDVNLDVYLYIRQPSPTTVPQNLINAPANIKVDSLAIWGLVNDSTYAVGGALTFTSASDASSVYDELPQQADIWTELSGRTIYVVQGSSGPAQALKTAIANNNFKTYDDAKALGEIARMPSGNATQPAAIGVIKPSQAAVNLLKQYVDAGTAATVNSIFTWTKPQVIVLGLYAPQQIDIADIARRVDNNTIWDVNLGVVASVSSVFPGFIASPIATHVMDGQGFAKETISGVTLYKIPFDAGNGRTISAMANIDGNHFFLAASLNQAYAQTLMLGIQR
jgi:hypothetical protein